MKTEIEYRVYVICDYDEYSQPFHVAEYDKEFKCPVEAIKYQRELNATFEDDCKDELCAENSFYIKRDTNHN